MNLQRDGDSGDFYIAAPRCQSQPSPVTARQTIPKVKPLAFGALRAVKKPPQKIEKS